MSLKVPAGETRVLRLALGCHLDRVVTTGLEGRYLYARSYACIEDVLAAAISTADEIISRSAALDDELLHSGLTADQQFLIAHATRSYYGSPQLLDVDGARVGGLVAGPALLLQRRYAGEVDLALVERDPRRGARRLGRLELEAEVGVIERRHHVAGRHLRPDLGRTRAELAADPEAEIGFVSRPHDADKVPRRVFSFKRYALHLDRALGSGSRRGLGLARRQQERRRQCRERSGNSGMFRHGETPFTDL